MWLLVLATSAIIAFWLYTCIVMAHAKFNMPMMEEAKPLTLNTTKPFISVLLPIARLQTDHNSLIETLVNQDYPNYEVTIIYEQQESLDTLRELPRLHLIENGSFFSPERSNKVSNLLLGLRHLSPNSEFLVFLDDDITVDRYFLQRFSYFLKLYPNSVITSYRYIASAGNFREHLLLVANNCVSTIMFLPMWHCIWGGCFGFHREMVDVLNLERLWEKSISDDMDLTTQVRDMGIPIRVTPESLCISRQFTTSYLDLLRWSIRQCRLARFFLSHSFVDTLALSLAFTLANLLPLVLLSLGSLLWLIPALLQMLAVCGTYIYFRRQGAKIAVVKSVVAFIVIPPLMFGIAVIALLGNDIEWKGRKYSLTSLPISWTVKGSEP